MQHYDSLCIKIRPLLSQVSWTHALFYATCVRMLVLSIISPKEVFCGNIVTRWNAVNGFKNDLQIYGCSRVGTPQRYKTLSITNWDELHEYVLGLLATFFSVHMLPLP